MDKTLSEMYDAIRQTIDGLDDDVKKAEGGNKAAGTRVRQAMQEVKSLAQDMRKGVLDLRNAENSG